MRTEGKRDKTARKRDENGILNIVLDCIKKHPDGISKKDINVVLVEKGFKKNPNLDEILSYAPDNYGLWEQKIFKIGVIFGSNNPDNIIIF